MIKMQGMIQRVEDFTPFTPVMKVNENAIEPEELDRDEVVEGKLFDLFRGSIIYKACMDSIHDDLFNALSYWDDSHTKVLDAMAESRDYAHKIFNWASQNRELGVYAPDDSEIESLIKLTINIYHSHNHLRDVYDKLVEEKNPEIMAAASQLGALSEAENGARLMVAAVREYVDLKE